MRPRQLATVELPNEEKDRTFLSIQNNIMGIAIIFRTPFTFHWSQLKCVYWKVPISCMRCQPIKTRKQDKIPEKVGFLVKI